MSLAGLFRQTYSLYSQTLTAQDSIAGSPRSVTLKQANISCYNTDLSGKETNKYGKQIIDADYLLFTFPLDIKSTDVVYTDNNWFQIVYIDECCLMYNRPHMMHFEVYLKAINAPEVIDLYSSSSSSTEIGTTSSSSYIKNWSSSSSNSSSSLSSVSSSSLSSPSSSTSSTSQSSYSTQSLASNSSPSNSSHSHSSASSLTSSSTESESYSTQSLESHSSPSNSSATSSSTQSESSVSTDSSSTENESTSSESSTSQSSYSTQSLASNSSPSNSSLSHSSLSSASKSSASSKSVSSSSSSSSSYQEEWSTSSKSSKSNSSYSTQSLASNSSPSNSSATSSSKSSRSSASSSSYSSSSKSSISSESSSSSSSSLTNHIYFCGDIVPDASGLYFESGTYGGQPAYTSGTYWLWYRSASGEWVVSTGKNVNYPGACWRSIAGHLIDEYYASGSYVGNGITSYYPCDYSSSSTSSSSNSSSSYSSSSNSSDSSNSSSSISSNSSSSISSDSSESSDSSSSNSSDSSSSVSSDSSSSNSSDSSSSLSSESSSSSTELMTSSSSSSSSTEEDESRSSSSSSSGCELEYCVDFPSEGDNIYGTYLYYGTYGGNLCYKNDSAIPHYMFVDDNDYWVIGYALAQYAVTYFEPTVGKHCPDSTNWRNLSYDPVGSVYIGVCPSSSSSSSNSSASSDSSSSVSSLYGCTESYNADASFSGTIQSSTFNLAGFYNGRPYYVNSYGDIIRYNNMESKWEIMNSDETVDYRSQDDSQCPDSALVYKTVPGGEDAGYIT